MIEAIILDFDGTVVESVDIKTDAFREMFRDHARAEEILAYHLRHNGVSRFVKLKHIYEEFLGLPFDDAQSRAAGERFSRIVCEKVIRCPFVPGAQRFLVDFSQRCPLYLVSATPHDELARIVAARQLERYFSGLFGCPPGTKRDHVAAIMSGGKFSNKRVFYIGDSLEDQRTAEQAGLQFIARRNKEDFQSHPLQFADLAEAGQYLKAHLSAVGMRPQ